MGIAATPQPIVNRMAAFVPPNAKLILEIGCRGAPFLQAIASNLGVSGKQFVGIDIEESAVEEAKRRFPAALYVAEDFLLWEPSIKFDIIIGNPPYVVAGDHLPPTQLYTYKKRFTTWKGRFNLYAAFIEKGIELLKSGGKLIYITPASWLIGDNFSLLRKHIASKGSLDIYYVGDVFRLKIPCVILVFHKGKLPSHLNLYDDTELVVSKAHYDGDIIRFENEEALNLEKKYPPLSDFFEIRVAARSKEFLASPFVYRKPMSGTVPVLTGRNLKKGFIDYETCFSGLWMRLEDAPRIREFYRYPRIVVAHTKGTKVVAAYDKKAYPWREEYHLLPKEGMEMDPDEVVCYLNSETVQKYIQSLYRNIIPHIVKEMLKRVPLPLVKSQSSLLPKGGF